VLSLFYTVASNPAHHCWFALMTYQFGGACMRGEHGTNDLKLKEYVAEEN
jgi:hypothetical protein